MSHVAYIVHDLHDAAVARRIALLAEHGAEIRVAGFRRREEVPEAIGPALVTDLGRTHDGRLAARAVSVLRQVLRPRRLRSFAEGADIILARNLECLVLAARIRSPGQRLVYECLDIHRLLLGSGVVSRLLHALEHWALRAVDLIVVSAPAFRDAYFGARRGWSGPILLAENKVPAALPPADTPGLPVKPWVIGWFGMLRCRRSFALLAELAASSEGAIEVLVAGIPSAAEFPDFASLVDAAPGVSWHGRYLPDELPGLFGRVHFVWAIDYFEEGLNSAWLLPNRLYEGLAFGAVPLALANVETGRWLGSRGVGLLLGDPLTELPAYLAALTAEDHARLRARVAAIPVEAVRLLPAEAARIAAEIAGTAPAEPSASPTLDKAA